MESLAGPQNEYLATGWNYFCANLLGVFRGSTCILWSRRFGGCWPMKSSHLWIQLAGCLVGGWKVCHFLHLQSVGQGVVYEQRHIPNMPSPKLYLHFTKVMYRLYVALFAVLKWAVKAYYCKFIFFYASTGKEALDFRRRMAKRELTKSETVHFTEKWLGTAL